MVKTSCSLGDACSYALNKILVWEEPVIEASIDIDRQMRILYQLSLSGVRTV